MSSFTSTSVLTEAAKIELNEMILNFRESGMSGSEGAVSVASPSTTSAVAVVAHDGAKLSFPPTMHKSCRAYVHELCKKYGLKSKSTGKGSSRYISVSAKPRGGRGDGSSAPQLGSWAFHQPSVKALHGVAKRYCKLQRPAHQAAGKTGSHSNFSSRRASSSFRLTGDKSAPSPPPQPSPSSSTSTSDALPVASSKDQILGTISSSQITLISGETGSGKSTQIPQYIMDKWPSSRIVVTQPRRISALSLSDRVRQERRRSGTRGAKGSEDVSHCVRLSSSVNAGTRLTFCTPALLLSYLSSSTSSSPSSSSSSSSSKKQTRNARGSQDDNPLNDFSHIIIDEVHNRELYTDFLLIYIKFYLIKRQRELQRSSSSSSTSPPTLECGPKVILMSATLKTRETLLYFKSFLPDSAVNHVDVKGRTYPIQSYFLEDALMLTNYGGFYSRVKEEDKTYYSSTQPPPPPPPPPPPEAEVDYCDHEVDGGAYYGDEDGDMGEQLTTDGGDASGHASFTCLLCNKSTFPNASALGIHMGTCMGTQTESYNEIEHRISAMSVSDTVTNLPETEDSDRDNFGGFSTFGSECGGPSAGKSQWDGSSPFCSSISLSTSASSNLLSKYHSTFDDANEIDFDLILSLLTHVASSTTPTHSVLVFLPGWHEISYLSTVLETTAPFSNRSKFSVLQLHSGIPINQQSQVFQPARQGARKIVLATNIAETSITIDDISFVIDCAKAKEKGERAFLIFTFNFIFKLFYIFLDFYFFFFVTTPSCCRPPLLTSSSLCSLTPLPDLQT